MVWFVFLPWLCGVQAQEEKKPCGGFVFLVRKFIEERKGEREEGRKGDFKPKQPERDSPLLVWFGVGFSFCLFSTIVRQMMIFEFALDKCLMLTSTNRWFCLGALFYA